MLVVLVGFQGLGRGKGFAALDTKQVFRVVVPSVLFQANISILDPFVALGTADAFVILVVMRFKKGGAGASFLTKGARQDA